MNKNKYHVIILYSSHNNFTNAQANCDQQKKAGKRAMIFYRGAEVHEDVKKIVSKPEGL
jgi:hypothetical protein